MVLLQRNAGRMNKRYGETTMRNPTASECKQATEIDVAQIFCHWYSREYGVSSGVIRKLVEPAPDVFIHIGCTDVALELASYHEKGIYNELYSLDRDFKAKLLEEFHKIGRNRLPRCTPRLDYKERAGKLRHYTIPQPHLWPNFGNELIALLQTHRKPRGDVGVTAIRFGPSGKVAKYARIDRKRLYVPTEKYPTISEYCSGVDLRWHPNLGIDRPSSSMNARFGRTDIAEIERMVRAKLSKLETYRREVPGMPVWLLYYAEGHTPTGRLIGKDQCSRVVQHLREMLAKQQPNFDAVWWANETSAVKGPEIFRVF